MNWLLELLLLIITLLGGTITDGVEPVAIIPDHPVGIDYHPLPAEDDPEWDCQLHGNHICGPVIELDDGRLVDDNGWVFRWGVDGRTPIDVDCVFAAPCTTAPVRPGCVTDLECVAAHGSEMDND